MRSLTHRIHLLFVALPSLIFSISTFLVIGLLVALLVAPTITFAQTDAPIAVQTVRVEDLVGWGNDLAVKLVLIVSATFLLVVIFQWLQSRQAAKTAEERRQKDEQFIDRVVTMLQDTNTRNAAEREYAAREMLPVKTVVEVVESAFGILGKTLNSRLLTEGAKFLEDITQTDEGEDLSVTIGTKDDVPKPPDAESQPPFSLSSMVEARPWPAQGKF